jgi:hypothetical protein
LVHMPWGTRKCALLILFIALAVLIYAFVCIIPGLPMDASDQRSMNTLPTMDIGEGDDVEGSTHVPLFILAGLLGLTAFVSGVKNSKYKNVRDLIPIDIPRKLHRYVSVTYYTAYLGTFALWSLQYYAVKGRIFYTTHGIVGLTSVIFAVLSIITGIAMFYRPTKWREAHWAFNIGTLVLLFVTMLVGLGLED